MAAPAGSLVVRIGADTSGLKRGAKQTESTLSKLGRGAGRVVGGLATLGAAAAAAGAAMTVGLVKSGLSAIDTQSKLAQSIGGTIDSVRALQIAAEDAGVSTQEMTGNLQRMNRRLGEVVSTGAGPAAQWIERLGINAQALLEMPLDDRVAVIADEISKLGTQAEMASAAFAIFGDAGLRMVPMLQSGGDAIRAAAREVDEFGLSLSEVDAAQVEAANDAMSRIGRVVESVRNQMAIAVAGPLKAFADWFATITKEGTTFRNVISQAFAVVGQYIGVAVNIGGIMLATFQRLYGVATSVVSAIGEGLAWLAEDFRKAVNTIIRGLNAVADFLPLIEGGIEEIQPGWIGRRFQDTMSIAEQAVAFSMEAIREYLGGTLPSENLERWLEEVREKSREAAEEAVKARGTILGGMGGEGGEDGEGEQEAFLRRFERIQAQFLTEQEALREHQQIMSDIERAWREGQIETEAEYRDLKEQAEAAHMERLKQIRERGMDDLGDVTEEGWRDQVKTTISEGNSMLSAAGRLNKKMFKIAQVAGAARAFIATLQGQAEALKLGWPAGPIAAAKIGAQGFGLVAAIKSADMNGGKISGSGGGGEAATDTPSTPDSASSSRDRDFVQDVSITLVGGNSIGEEQLEQLGQVLADNGGRIGAFRISRAA